MGAAHHKGMARGGERVERSSGAAPPLSAGPGGDPEESQTLTISIEPAVHACPVLVFAGELDLSTVPRLERTVLTRLASNARWWST
jgi:hypothetical protein